MFKTARYLCLALFVLLFSCVTTGKRYSSDQLASKFYNSVENINNKTLDKLMM